MLKETEIETINLHYSKLPDPKRYRLPQSYHIVETPDTKWHYPSEGEYPDPFTKVVVMVHRRIMDITEQTREYTCLGDWDDEWHVKGFDLRERKNDDPIDEVVAWHFETDDLNHPADYLPNFEKDGILTNKGPWYISGAVSSDPDFRKKFAIAEKKLKEKGLKVVNPVKREKEGKAWDWYLRKDIRKLTRCHGIILLPDWKDSAGARLEKSIADGLGMEVRFFNFTDGSVKSVM